VIYGEHINDKSKIQREDNLKDGDAEIGKVDITYKKLEECLKLMRKHLV
jgi:hypothetical protein